MAILKVNNVSLNFEQVGSGEAIIFLHGFTGSNEDWVNQMSAIKDLYRGIAIDLRGHGKSEAPTSENDYSIYLNSEDIYQLLSKLGIHRCCIVGHSMGGFTALQFILDHPNFVQGLVLVDTSSGEWDVVPGYTELRAKLKELAKKEGLDAAFTYDAANNPVRIERFAKQPEQREIARRKILNTSLDGYIYVPDSFGKWQPVTKRLNEIAIPTIIFRGEHDTGFIRASNILKESIKGAKLFVIQDAHHNPHEECPASFNDAFLKFLAEIKWK